jgi:hypothetical protein
MTSPAEPYQGIIDAAREHRCDLVCIGSHGRGGVATVILGSVAQKVLSRSTIAGARLPLNAACKRRPADRPRSPLPPGGRLASASSGGRA